MFDYKINGVPCLIHVVFYAPATDEHRYGTGYGDVSPPEPEEIEYEVLDRSGRRAKWLDKYVTPEVHSDIIKMLRGK